MKIYDAKYQRTFKVADYESEVIALAAIVDEGEDAGDVLGNLKSLVNSQATRPQAASVEKTTKEVMPKATPEKKPETTRTPVTAPAKEEKKEVVKEEKAVEEKKVAAPAKEKVVKAPAVTPYTRTNDDHRGKLGTLIDSIVPGWRENPPAKEVAKGLSQSSEGKPFIDAKGNFVPEFLAELNKALAPFTTESSEDL